MTILVSVVMSVFNNENYLVPAIRSILDQSMSEFEFIIIDDGSTDRSSNLLHDLALENNKIRIIVNKKNVGLALSLNKGIRVSRGRYIARMDADDISLPNRLENQLNYLEKNPNIYILGGNVIQIDRNGDVIKNTVFPTDANILRWNLLLGTDGVVAHPSVMIRKEFFDKYGYYSNLETSQDKELWSRLFSMDEFPLTNYPDFILKYRMHSENISSIKRNIQIENSLLIRSKNLEKLMGIKFDLDVISSYINDAPEKIDAIKQKNYIIAWKNIFYTFIRNFNLDDDSKAIIYKQLIKRISSHISINPINVIERNKLSFWRCLNLFNYHEIIDILIIKSNSLHSNS